MIKTPPRLASRRPGGIFCYFYVATGRDRNSPYNKEAKAGTARTSRADPALAALFYPAHPFARFYAAQKRTFTPQKETSNKCKIMYNLSMKRYNMVHAAKLLGVTRQTLYNWIRRGWVKPGRDYKDYPVFTEADMRKIKKWKETIR